MMRRSFPLLLVAAACCAAKACTSENADPYATGVELPCCTTLEMEMKDWKGDGNWFYKCTRRQSCPRDVAVVQSFGASPMTILDVENNVSLGTLMHPTPTDTGPLNYYYYTVVDNDFSVRIASSGKIVTADRFREVGIIWSATGTKLKEIPSFVMADETYIVARSSCDEVPCNRTKWWPPIEAAHVFSPDGNRLLFKSDKNPTIVSLLDMESLDSHCELTHKGSVRVASFDSAGLRVLTVEKNGDVTTWNASDCRIVARIPYGGNQSQFTDSVAWAANGRLVAMIETDSWSEARSPYDGGFRVHRSRRLAIFEATTGQQVHSTSLTQSDSCEWWRENKETFIEDMVMNNISSDNEGEGQQVGCAPLIYARGEIILVNIRYRSSPGGNELAPWMGAGGGPFMADVTIFNASNGAVLQDFTQRHWNKDDDQPRLFMEDVDQLGEHLLVSEQKLVNRDRLIIGYSREVWDVATGNLSRALRPHNHSEAKGFVGAGRFAVDKELGLKAVHPPFRHRAEIWDLKTDKRIASVLGIQKAYATVTTCDDHFVVV